MEWFPQSFWPDKQLTCVPSRTSIQEDGESQFQPPLLSLSVSFSLPNLASRAYFPVPYLYTGRSSHSIRVNQSILIYTNSYLPRFLIKTADSCPLWNCLHWNDKPLIYVSDRTDQGTHGTGKRVINKDIYAWIYTTIRLASQNQWAH